MPTTEGAWTIRRLLEWTNGFFTRKKVDAPRRSAELLLSHVLKLPRISLYTQFERPLEESQLSEFRELVRRAGEQEPIAYLTRKAHFFNLELDVTRDVLIPRPDTEVLVEQVISRAKQQVGMERPRVLDLCTGSGCIALAIAKQIPALLVTATDISPAALDVARRNAKKLGLDERIVFLQGDLFDALDTAVDRQPYHLIVSNPPYIARPQLATLDKSVRDFEPRLALDGGEDGLDFHRRILARAADHLLPGGRIYLEIAFDQGPAALELAQAHPALHTPQLLKDYAGQNRVLTLQKP